MMPSPESEIRALRRQVQSLTDRLANVERTASGAATPDSVPIATDLAKRLSMWEAERLANVALTGEAAPTRGANGMSVGDRVHYRIDGRCGVAEDFLHDGDADVRFDDGTTETVHWCHLEPERAAIATLRALVDAAREQAIRHDANARDGKCDCEVCAAFRALEEP